MSADDGIYVGRFPMVGGGVEYRVTYASAIDNVEYGSEEIQDACRAAVFGACESITDRDEAWKVARNESDTVGYTEYGVSEIQFNRPLKDLTKEEIKAILSF